MKKNIFEMLQEVDKQLLDSAKSEFNKLSEVERDTVLDTTNGVVDSVCKALGISDSSKFHLTNEMFDTAVEKCNSVKDTCIKTTDKVCDAATKLMSENKLSKQEAIDTVNSLIKNTCETFGISNANKYMIDDTDNVYIKVAKPDSNGIHITCSNLKNGCYNECCDECDGSCKNPDCTETACSCHSKEDADNMVDSPSKTTKSVSLNLSAAKKHNNTKYNKKTEGLAPEMVNPASTRRIAKTADGQVVEGANPYASNLKSNQVTKNHSENLKSRLLDEANAPKVGLRTIAVKETLVNKIVSILEDSSTHNYTVYPKTNENPAAVEVVLEDVCSSIRDNMYILSDIASELKTLYEFSDVHINVIDTDNYSSGYVNLIVFMVLE